MIAKRNSLREKLISMLVIAFVIAMLATAIVPTHTVFGDSTIYVTNLEPSWSTADGQGGVFSAYVGPPSYGYVSPGTTAVYDGREAGIIKAGLVEIPGMKAFLLSYHLSQLML